MSIWRIYFDPDKTAFLCLVCFVLHAKSYKLLWLLHHLPEWFEFCSQNLWCFLFICFCLADQRSWSWNLLIWLCKGSSFRGCLHVHVHFFISFLFRNLWLIISSLQTSSINQSNLLLSWWQFTTVYEEFLWKFFPCLGYLHEFHVETTVGRRWSIKCKKRRILGKGCRDISSLSSLWICLAQHLKKDEVFRRRKIRGLGMQSKGQALYKNSRKLDLWIQKRANSTELCGFVFGVAVTCGMLALLHILASVQLLPLHIKIEHFSII